MSDIVFIGAPGGTVTCPQCGGKATLVHKTLEDMACERPKACTVSYWLRNGIAEDAGVCVAERPS